MSAGLFILAMLVTALSGAVLVVVGATCQWEDPCTVRMPPWDNILAALGMLSLQAICWVVWGYFYGCGA